MPRKSVAVPTSPSPVQEKPADVRPPKTKVNGEAEYTDDDRTQNALVIQKVSVPFTFRKTTEFKDCLRIFIRPDELHEEFDAQWDAHEDDEQAALNRIFNAYGKGHGTEISILHNVDAMGRNEYLLSVRRPKPDIDEDERLPSVLIDPKASIGDMVLDMFYEMGSDDPPDDFVSRGALEDLVSDLKGEVDELEPIRSLLDEFDMPGDKPAHLYSLPDRLRSIFRTVKGLSK